MIEDLALVILSVSIFIAFVFTLNDWKLKDGLVIFVNKVAAETVLYFLLISLLVIILNPVVRHFLEK